MTAEPTPAAPSAGTVVLIHGLWMTPLSWEGWKQRFESKGYRVLTPGWPGIDDRSVEEVRADPSPLAGVGVGEIVDHYDAIIRGLDAPPIIMGHSFGGLVTQLLLARGLGAAGVSVDGAQPRGILGLPLSTARIAMWGGLNNPFAPKRVIMLSPKQFHYAFTNLIEDEAEAKAIYDRLPVPGPARTLIQAGLANFNPGAVTKIDFKQARPPLLLLAGGKDHVVPASVTRANYKLQRKSPSVTELKEYADRSHYTVAQEGFEAVADHAIAWAAEHAKTS
jgi:pimeloyl-ACP methyl ester carboxylesterase